MKLNKRQARGAFSRLPRGCGLFVGAVGRAADDTVVHGMRLLGMQLLGRPVTCDVPDLSDRRVRWTVLGDDCKAGHWYQAGD